VDPADRWTHVYVAFDRRAEFRDPQTDNTEVWVDGVPLEHATGYSYGSYKSRSMSNPVAIGGTRYTYAANPTFSSDACVSNATYGLTTRVFPGIIDEVRLYERKLMADEIRYLAAHPVVAEKRAPAVDAPTPASARPVAREATVFAVTFQGEDPKQTEGLVCRWLVLAGAAGNVTFADPTARSTTATFGMAGDYVLQLEVDDHGRKVYSDPISVAVQRRGLSVILR